MADVTADLATPQGPAAAVTAGPRQALRRSRRGLWAIGAALGGFAALFVLVRAERSAAIDAAVTLRLQRTKHPSFDALMRAVSWPGFPPQSRIIVPTLIASLWAFGLRLEAIFQAVAWGGALISTLVKAVVQRPRPMPETVRVVVAPLGGSSFPSGHVLTYVGVYGFLAHLVHALLRRPAGLRRAVVAALVGLVALVGPSRIQQGHHWPTDVLASYLLGLPFLAAVIALYRRFKATGATPASGTPAPIAPGGAPTP